MKRLAFLMALVTMPAMAQAPSLDVQLKAAQQLLALSVQERLNLVMAIDKANDEADRLRKDNERLTEAAKCEGPKGPPPKSK